MNSIKFHSIVFALLLPCVMVISEGMLIINIIGIAYILLLFKLSKTKLGKRFIRRYYREVLRIEAALYNDR